MKNLILIFALALATTVNAQYCSFQLQVVPDNHRSHSFSVVETMIDGTEYLSLDDYRTRRLRSNGFVADGRTYTVTMSLLVGDVPYQHLVKDTYVVYTSSENNVCTIAPDKTQGDYSTLSIGEQDVFLPY